jgi:hypothetical protein
LFVLTRIFPAKSATAQTKAFCFFFSKKKALPCFLWVNLQGGWYYKQEFFWLFVAKKDRLLASVCRIDRAALARVTLIATWYLFRN